jgi:DNA-binding IclR family transcriptional regulator
VSYTERTIVELEPLLEELARIRRRGYATAIGEYELGLNAVAAPVHDARGNVIAAVDIWGPAFRLTPRGSPSSRRRPGRRRPRSRSASAALPPDARPGLGYRRRAAPRRTNRATRPDRTVAGALPAR